MRYTYLVGTDEQLGEFQGQEFVTLLEARQYADNHDLLILELQWEYSDYELIK